MFIGQQSRSGIPSIDDILRHTQCKLLMPFTDDLKDHSAYAHQVNNVGVILGENGAVFNGSSAYLKVPKLVNEWSSDWTCEFIITCPNTAISESDLVIDARSDGSGWMIRINSGYIDVAPTNGSTAYYAKAPLANNETAHIAATKRGSIFSIYKNGEFVQSCSDTRTLSVSPTWNIGKNNSTNAYYLKGTLGGFRFINRVLSPPEFNLTRPFKILEINFQQGNKTYLYKNGILDPRIVLPADIVNDTSLGCLRWNKQGTTWLNMDLPDLKGKNLFVKYWLNNLNNSPTFYIAVCDSKGVIKYVEGRPSNEALSTKCYCYTGINGEEQQSTMYRISASVYVGVFRVYEIWYE